MKLYTNITQTPSTLLTNGTHFFLEVKGQPTQQDQSKQIALKDWIEAISKDRRFGLWTYATSTYQKGLPYIIQKATQEKTIG